MKQFTHAWLAFAAVKRLSDMAPAFSNENRACAESLVEWFRDYRDDVLQGAWYPDSVFKDMATSHILKIVPSDTSANRFKDLPNNYNGTAISHKSPLRSRSFYIKIGNLPDRCEAFAHGLVDNLKIQEQQIKGSPIVPTGNHIALRFFILSHYIADAHVPFHCDNRPLSKLHGQFEEVWEKEVRNWYVYDDINKRFSYDASGFPLVKDRDGMRFDQSIPGRVLASLDVRPFVNSYGPGNNNVWDFMSAVCQNSYLLSYELAPQGSPTEVTYKQMASQNSAVVDQILLCALCDAVDATSKIWLRIWSRFLHWKIEKK